MRPDWELISDAGLRALPPALKAFGVTLQKQLRSSKKMFDRGILIKDNMYAATEVTFSCTHGVLSTIDNPLPTLPLAFTPYKVRLADGSKAFPIASFDFDPSLGNGQLGLTVNYAIDSPQQLSKTATPSLTSGVSTLVTGWGAPTRNYGSVISESGGTWTVSESGIYLVTASLNWELASTSYTRCFTYLTWPNLPFQPQVDSGALNNTWNDQVLSYANKLNAGDTLQLNALQANSTATARAPTVQMSVQRIASTETPSANVTGILWGG